MIANVLSIAGTNPTGGASMHGALAASAELDVGHSHGPLHHFYRLRRQTSDGRLLSSSAADERIVEAGWFARDHLPIGHVFPAVLRDAFWDELSDGFLKPRNSRL